MLFAFFCFCVNCSSQLIFQDKTALTIAYYISFRETAALIAAALYQLDVTADINNGGCTLEIAANVTNSRGGCKGIKQNWRNIID